MPGDFRGHRSSQWNCPFWDERSKEEKWIVSAPISTIARAAQTGAAGISKPDAAVACPDIGLIGRLGDLYKFTPLDPFAKK